MSEREPIHIEDDPAKLAVIELDPILQYDTEGIDLLIGMYLDVERKAEKEGRGKEFYSGRRDMDAVVVGLLGLTDVVEGILPHPVIPPTLSETQVRSLVSIYFNELDKTKKQGQSGVLDTYDDGVRIELHQILINLGQFRAAYRDDEIGPNTMLPGGDPRSLPGLRNLVRERFGDSADIELR